MRGRGLQAALVWGLLVACRAQEPVLQLAATQQPSDLSTAPLPAVVPVGDGSDAGSVAPPVADQGAGPSSSGSSSGGGDGSDVIPGQYIVVLDGSAGDAVGTIKSAQKKVASKLRRGGRSAAAGAAADAPVAAAAADAPQAPAPPPFSVLRASRAAAGASFAAVKVTPNAGGSGASEADVISELAAQPGVLRVVPDRVVRAAVVGPASSVPPPTAAAVQQQQAAATPSGQGGCAAPRDLGRFVPARHAIAWPSCLLGAGRVLVYYGRRCGGDFSQVRWEGMYAADVANLSVPASPDCQVHKSDKGFRLGSKLRDAFFGSCGKAPTAATSLPTRVCVAATAGCSNSTELRALSVPAAVEGCGASSDGVVYQGTPCGPGRALIRWTQVRLAPAPGAAAASGARCAKRRAGDGDPLFDASWLGDCGVPPANFKGALPYSVCGAKVPRAWELSAATLRAGSLAREPLAAGESTQLVGMPRIQAVVDDQVPAGAADLNVTVAVIDTGGTNLPDLNEPYGVSMLNGTLGQAWHDVYTHGTHVSGTIGARNQGAGVYGVLPGVRVLPIKVLDDSGSGSYSDVMAGIDYAIANSAALGISVINLSLGGSGKPDDPICNAVQAAVNAGLVVVSAAGNDGVDLMTSLPAACSASIAATALNTWASDAPASFSNWIDPSTPDAQKRRVLAAPGVQIISTVPAGYAYMSGTSMATPHVSGVAARCFAAGDCKLADGAANMKRVVDAAWAKYQADPGYRWNQGADPVNNRKWYGPLVFADRW